MKNCTSIGVLSDTHLYSWPSDLLEKINLHFAGVELILHAGDIVNPLILDSLTAPVTAVCGNSDSSMVASSLPAKRLLTINGFTIGLTHGYGASEDLGTRLLSLFGPLDILIYGHTHVAALETNGATMLFNPGSPTRPRDGQASVGILQLHDKISAKIIRL